jgi:hypothetical protein
VPFDAKPVSNDKIQNSHSERSEESAVEVNPTADSSAFGLGMPFENGIPF